MTANPFHDAPQVVVVPVKDFTRAKVRLAPALDPAERAALARAMATTVVQAAQQSFPVAVVCDDADVADWAVEAGAHPIWCPGTGLNGAVERGGAQLAEVGVRQMIVTHADLPRARSYARFTPWPGVSLVPDRHGTGTNVIAVDPALGFRFSYGRGSFRRHVAEATRIGSGLRIVRDANLQWDVDLPEDLVGLPA